MSIENTNDIVINNTVINNTVINNKDGDLDLEKESEIRIYNTWDELDLNPDLLRSIYGHGFEKPSPIQSKGIAPIKEGRDIIAQAQSGTGKTATFSIGALSMLKIEEPTSQVIIISPTRELTIQTGFVVSGIGSMMSNLKVQTFFGGSSVDENIEQLNDSTHSNFK